MLVDDALSVGLDGECVGDQDGILVGVLVGFGVGRFVDAGQFPNQALMYTPVEAQKHPPWLFRIPPFLWHGWLAIALGDADGIADGLSVGLLDSVAFDVLFRISTL